MTGLSLIAVSRNLFLVLRGLLAAGLLLWSMGSAVLQVSVVVALWLQSADSVDVAHGIGLLWGM